MANLLILKFGENDLRHNLIWSFSVNWDPNINLSPDWIRQLHQRCHCYS